MREKLLGILELLSFLGEGGFTVNNLEKVTGVNKFSLYVVTKNKEDIFVSSLIYKVIG